MRSTRTGVEKVAFRVFGVVVVFFCDLNSESNVKYMRECKSNVHVEIEPEVVGPVRHA